ncbi:acyl-CoA dehydrogenase family protein [Corynebacterium pseudodiphtheriticum]|uniref:acyl-CoA dehydrogenase family protein n=1 Tax=Corynebacterium pseudodiphtheriticum TaxID=37637 RepID=UPI00234CA3C9|nr:acyl-CoA dehydrogenase family protein [Corynebacterium pseudodiphtheriticum]MDC7068676.1 acyl-CoA dehydrogenase family protein [Corynebacterium pseudodiphtheriticum]MDC7084742.1 acyl-CoA dehydrogenase family protein [Corynebacterium pseudodiphtheriticum]MDC7086793.1 acyl-CoA dehydrogenase family protein [Corynebacterium pseudodiphtheriticum]MDC7113144.1 acyl-CoA dehydrogenase family protein [Corynebacterium pseudodiphtheriticum]MDK4236800.1 acyl-CoA dehydrogenase family protein [Corynebacte
MSTNPLATGTDLLGVFNDIPEADLNAWKRAASLREPVEAVINDYWQRAEIPFDLIPEIVERDLLTDGLDVPGHETLSHLGSGLTLMEVARIDGSVATILAVQAGLAMRSIDMCGSQEQKDKYLPKMATGELLGAFALTEPDHGSDSIALETTAARDGDEWVLNGEKKWIGLGKGGDISVVWARTEDGEVSGFIVPQDAKGYDAQVIENKISLRAIHQAHIKLKDVRIPAENQLQNAKTFKDTAAVLMATRTGVAWIALGAAIACYEKAREYADERIQFGRRLSESQIIQQRLVDMQLEISQMMLLNRHIAELNASGKLTGEQASFNKLRCTRGARKVAADARDMLGGVGILLDNNIARHFADIEAYHTYEGTDTVQSLIIGKKITGVGAFK